MFLLVPKIAAFCWKKEVIRICSKDFDQTLFIFPFKLLFV